MRHKAIITCEALERAAYAAGMR